MGRLDDDRDQPDRDQTADRPVAQQRLSDEAKQIANDRTELDTRSSKYYDQLMSSFTAMDRQVSAFKATQSYLDQQIKIWTSNGN